MAAPTLKNLIGSLIGGLLRFFGYVPTDMMPECRVAVIFSQENPPEEVAKVVDVMPCAIREGFLAHYYTLAHMDVGAALGRIRGDSFKYDMAYLQRGAEADSRFEALREELRGIDKIYVIDY